MKKAVLTGSFDPITKGHEWLVRKALQLFDEVIIAVGKNSSKNSFFTFEKRIQLIEATFKDEKNVKVVAFQGLTADFCRENGISHIIRGLRTASDFDYESLMAEANKLIDNNLETIFFTTPAELRCISSTLVRDILSNKGNPQAFVPEKIINML